MNDYINMKIVPVKQSNKRPPFKDIIIIVLTSIIIFNTILYSI